MMVRGYLNARIGEAIANRHACELRKFAVFGVVREHEIGERGNVLAGIALAGQEDRSFHEGRVLQQKALERVEEMSCESVFVGRNFGSRLRDAEADADRLVDEQQPAPGLTTARRFVRNVTLCDTI